MHEICIEESGFLVYMIPLARQGDSWRNGRCMHVLFNVRVLSMETVHTANEKVEQDQHLNRQSPGWKTERDSVLPKNFESFGLPYAAESGVLG
jgi:hypothetical protein